jgi:uncharacterized protein YjdB
MASSSTLVIHAPKALLPGSNQPQSATIEVDTATGKITAVHQGLKSDLGSEGQQITIDESKILLPGLIE